MSMCSACSSASAVARSGRRPPRSFSQGQRRGARPISCSQRQDRHARDDAATAQALAARGGRIVGARQPMPTSGDTSARRREVDRPARPVRHARLHRGPRPLHRRRRGAAATSNLMKAASWDEIVRMVAAAVEEGEARAVDRRPRLASGEVEVGAGSRTSKAFRPTSRSTRSRRTIPSSSRTRAATRASPTRRRCSCRTSTAATRRIPPAARF